MSLQNKNIGRLGEDIASKFLLKKGYQIREKNFTSHWGELDLVVQKKDKIIFVEVKTRVGDAKGKPYESVNFYKLRGLKRAIQYYLLKNKLKDYKLALDLISIILNPDLSVKELKYFENIEGR